MSRRHQDLSCKTNAWRLIVAVTACGIIGCGLGDYEDQIDKQIKKASMFEADARLIGPPLRIPQNENGGLATPVAFYLRPPANVNSEESEILTAPRRGVLDKNKTKVFHYEGNEGLSVFIATAPVTDDNATSAAKSPESKKNTFTASTFPFAFAVRAAMLEYFRKNYGEPQDQAWDMSEIQMKADSRKSNQGPTMEFLKFSLVGKQTKDENGKLKAETYFFFYFYKIGPEQIAIAYEIPAEMLGQSTMETTRKTVNLSLTSLALGPSAHASHARYQKLHGTRGPSPAAKEGQKGNPPPQNETQTKPADL